MENTKQTMNEVLTLQKNHFIKHGSPSIELRVDRLNRLKSMIMKIDMILLMRSILIMGIGQKMPH